MVVVDVDLTFGNANDETTMDRFPAELGQKFKVKDLGDTRY